MRLSLLVVTLTTALLVAAGIWYFGDDPVAFDSSLSVAEALSQDTTGFLRADGPRRFRFPEDHGPHPGYRTEWWYFTGNLVSPGGRRFGFQLTFFRTALAPPDDDRTIAKVDWAADQLYMAHFAVTDISANRLQAFERFSRGAVGLAGAAAAPLRVWLEDWSVREQAPGFHLRLQAEQEDVGIDLQLTPLKPLVLQGNAGFDRKGPGPGDASYYYSFTRLDSRGTIKMRDDVYEVFGLSWMDHEWSTSVLGEDEVGWDWFSLQLDDGRDLMYYRLRRRDGTISPFTTGVVVDSTGGNTLLKGDDVQLEVLDEWRSPDTGIEYPAGWRLVVPGEAIDLEVAPAVNDQELDLSVRYWEGTVRAAGQSGGKPVRGRGYVELTGYGEERPLRAAGVVAGGGD